MYLNKAIEEAKKSRHRHRIGAVVFKRKRIISYGHNEAPRSARNLHPRFYKWPGSIHAEIAAILKAKTDLRGCSILVIRINRDNKLMYSRPCKYCMMYLEYVGIKKVFYSTNSGIIADERII